jgi:hypothetical protein
MYGLKPVPFKRSSHAGSLVPEVALSYLEWKSVPQRLKPSMEAVLRHG